MPLYSITDADGHGAYKVIQRVPDIRPSSAGAGTSVQAGWRLSAVMRNMLYHNPSSGKTVTRSATDFQLSVSAHSAARLTAYYQGFIRKRNRKLYPRLAGICGNADMAPSATIRTSSTSEGSGAHTVPCNTTSPRRLSRQPHIPRAAIRQRLRPAFCRQPIQITRNTQQVTCSGT